MYTHTYACIYVESERSTIACFSRRRGYQPVLTNISIPTSCRSLRALPPSPISLRVQASHHRSFLLLPSSLSYLTPASLRLLSTPFTGDVELCDVDSRRATVVPPRGTFENARTRDRRWRKSRELA